MEYLRFELQVKIIHDHYDEKQNGLSKVACHLSDFLSDGHIAVETLCKDCDNQEDYDTRLAYKGKASHYLGTLDDLHILFVGLGVLNSYYNHISSEEDDHNGCHKYKLSHRVEVCDVPQDLPLL